MKAYDGIRNIMFVNEFVEHSTRYIKLLLVRDLLQSIIDTQLNEHNAEDIKNMHKNVCTLIKTDIWE